MRTTFEEGSNDDGYWYLECGVALGHFHRFGFSLQMTSRCGIRVQLDTIPSDGFAETDVPGSVGSCAF